MMTTSEATTESIDFSVMGEDVRRVARAADEYGFLRHPEDEAIDCVCGHQGEPEAVIDYGAFDLADSEQTLCVCPDCGEAIDPDRQ